MSEQKRRVRPINDDTVALSCSVSEFIANCHEALTAMGVHIRPAEHSVRAEIGMHNVQLERMVKTKKAPVKVLFGLAMRGINPRFVLGQTGARMFLVESGERMNPNAGLPEYDPLYMESARYMLRSLYSSQVTPTAEGIRDDILELYSALLASHTSIITEHRINAAAQTASDKES